MSKRLPWFRMYADFLNDPKLISLAFEDQRHFIGVLALKCDGAIDDVADGDLLDRIVAQRLWIDHAVIRDVKRRLIAAGLIDARWQPLAWDKRQMRSDVDATGAERQRRYRDAQKHNALRDAAVTRLEEELDKEEDTDKEEEEEKTKKTAPRKRAATPSQPDIAKPDDVEPQTWADFLKLRKAKRAPVTQTVVDEAKRECAKAGMTLKGFLRVWCRRGSQGLEAAWLKPDERAQGQAAVETPYQRSMRERMQEAAPEIARRAPTAPQQDAADFFRTVDAQSRVVDVKAIEVTP